MRMHADDDPIRLATCVADLPEVPLAVFIIDDVMDLESLTQQ